MILWPTDPSRFTSIWILLSFGGDFLSAPTQGRERTYRRIMETMRYSPRWLEMLMTFPSGSRTMIVRRPHGSSVSG